MTYPSYQKQSSLYYRILCAMLLLLVLRCVGASAYRAAAAPGGLFGLDFRQYYDAAARLNAGQPFYFDAESARNLAYQHVSSPLVPVIVWPLTRFPLETAARIWAGFNVGLLMLATLLFCWGTRLRFPEDTASVLLVILCGFRFWPTTIELGIGNSDIVPLTLVGGMFVCARYEKWILFAALVVLAALTKTWMLGALFYLIVRRKWGAMAAGAAFLAAGLAILFSIAGWHEWTGFVRVTTGYASQPDLISNSVAGMGRLYFTKNQLMTPLLDNRACYIAVLAAGYGFLIAGLGYLWRLGPRMDQAQRQMCLALTPLALVLGSPVSHQQYYIFALPALWLLLLGQGYGWKLQVGAFAVYLALTLPLKGLNPVPEYCRHGGIQSLQVAETFLCGITLWAIGLLSVASGFGNLKRKTPGT
jgi:hypothetical protein